ncbi:Alpha/beta-hydrolase [Mycena kentingensis (nom. inval.)]|nr:Alpha/beta-hydrolase [Mycena kentingensis (nom. inval.)]
MSARPVPQTAPYGTWGSPISAATVSALAASIEDVLVDAVTEKVYLVEKRPDEGGRNVILHSGDRSDVFGAEWDARTGVHSYGGIAAVVHDDMLLFSNASDTQVYKMRLDSSEEGRTPRAITAANACRFASFACHPGIPELVACVMEDHTDPALTGVANQLVCLDTRLKTQRPAALVSGTDFYASPTFNADGTLLAWTQWQHPDVPWDGSQVYVAAIRVQRTGLLTLVLDVLPPIRVAGASSTICATQPNWISHHTLMFCSDESGYQNPFVASIDIATKSTQTRAVLAEPIQEDFAEPSWTLGTSNYAVLDEGSGTALFVTYRDGRSVLYRITQAGECTEVSTSYVQIERVRRVGPWTAVFLANRADRGREVIWAKFAPGTTIPELRILDANRAPQPVIPDAFISLPYALELTSPSTNKPFHVVYYLPTNPDYAPPAGERPPAVINVHGGPTFLEKQSLNLEKQFFTSRGWVWVDVNYSGSANLGREYINRLKGNWGVVDIDDCIQTVLLLSSTQYGAIIDRKRAVIRGRSAGGYATLSALSRPPAADPDPMPVFAAGTSCYGISDLRKLIALTHKFQCWYAQNLVGGTYEEVPEVYEARSPVFHADNIRAPLLILQGAADPIVPPSQAADMIRVIKARGGTVEYVVFEGEGHGWRKAETIEKALTCELEFYQLPGSSHARLLPATASGS